MHRGNISRNKFIPGAVCCCVFGKYFRPTVAYHEGAAAEDLTRQLGASCIRTYDFVDFVLRSRSGAVRALLVVE